MIFTKKTQPLGRILGYYECMCDSPDHMVRLAYYEGGKHPDPWVYMTVHFPNHNSFWQRLRLAFLYLFRKESLDVGAFADVLWNLETAKGISKFLRDFIRETEKQGKN